nr:hypothetical protein [Tanacetum cinerariifolium]
MVSYLNKSDTSKGFNQVIDFLNGSYIKYALTSNDVTRLQALIDRKKVVITVAAIRDVLHLDDAEGVNCLPNEEIFAELARMGYEKLSTKLTFYKAFFLSQWKLLIHTILQLMSAKCTSWNEFSSTMASADICLSTGRKFNFSKYIFESLEALDACAALTRRVEHLEHDKVTQALEITKLKIRVKKLERANKKAEDAQVASDEQVKGRQAEIYQIDMDHALKVLSMLEDEPEVQEVVEVVTTAKLITEVVAAVSKSVTATSTTISAAEPQVPAATITDAPVRVVDASTRKRKGVVIRDPEEESTVIIPAETKSKDKGKGIMVEEPKHMKKKQQVEMGEEYARKLHEELNKDIEWDVVIDHVKQKAKEDPFVQRYQVMKKRPQTEAQTRRNMIMYLKNSKEQLEEEENKAIESINETPAQKAANRRKLNEEVKDLKQHLEIVPVEDNDVYTKATPLARKVPVVDYQIIQLNNKPHYKII